MRKKEPAPAVVLLPCVRSTDVNPGRIVSVYTTVPQIIAMNGRLRRMMLKYSSLITSLNNLLVPTYFLATQILRDVATRMRSPLQIPCSYPFARISFWISWYVIRQNLIRSLTFHGSIAMPLSHEV